METKAPVFLQDSPIKKKLFSHESKLYLTVLQIRTRYTNLTTWSSSQIMLLAHSPRQQPLTFRENCFFMNTLQTDVIADGQAVLIFCHLNTTKIITAMQTTSSQHYLHAHKQALWDNHIRLT